MEESPLQTGSGGFLTLRSSLSLIASLKAHGAVPATHSGCSGKVWASRWAGGPWRCSLIPAVPRAAGGVSSGLRAPHPSSWPTSLATPSSGSAARPGRAVLCKHPWPPSKPPRAMGLRLQDGAEPRGDFIPPLSWAQLFAARDGPSLPISHLFRDKAWSLLQGF